MEQYEDYEFYQQLVRYHSIRLEGKEFEEAVRADVERVIINTNNCNEQSRIPNPFERFLTEGLWSGLDCMFVWQETPEGFDYWGERYYA